MYSNAQHPERNIYKVVIPNGDSLEFANSLKNTPGIKDAEPFYQGHALYSFDDPCPLWSLDAFNARPAYDTNRGAGTIIAGIDVGIPVDPDVEPNLIACESTTPWTMSRRR